jgi:hypothetical protein
MMARKAVSSGAMNTARPCSFAAAAARARSARTSGCAPLATLDSVSGVRADRMRARSGMMALQTGAVGFTFVIPAQAGMTKEGLQRGIST